MSKLVLHVGTHKTGTSAVQNAFADARASLSEVGIVYPRIGIGSGHHALLAPWDPRMKRFSRGGDMRRTWRKLARTHARSDRTLVLSSEELSRQGTERPADLGWIADTMAGFDEIEVVLVLRNQASFVQSIWLEVARKQPPPDWSGFVDHAISSGVATGLGLDYTRLLAALFDAFGAQSVTVHDHDDLSGRTGGAIGAVLAAAGGPDGIVSQPFDPRRANVSPSPLAFWAADRVSAPERPDPALLRCAQGVIDERFGPDGGGASARTTLFKPEELARLRQTLEPSNRRLAEMLEAAGKPALRLEWPSIEGTVSRGHISTRYWIDLARAIRGIPPPKDPAGA